MMIPLASSAGTLPHTIRTLVEPKLYALTIAGGRLGTAIVRNLFLKVLYLAANGCFYDGCLFLLYPFAFSFFLFPPFFIHLKWELSFRNVMRTLTKEKTNGCKRNISRHTKPNCRFVINLFQYRLCGGSKGVRMARSISTSPPSPLPHQK